MSDNNRQFARKVDIGDVSIEGRQANGITADNNGNVFIYSGLKDTELKDLTDQQYDGNVPFYYGNSYMAVIKSKTHTDLKLGNNKWDLDQKDDDPNKYVQPQNNNTSDCSKEFDEDADIFLNWENDNTNLGWGPYGSGISPFKLAKLNLEKNYWNANNGKYFTKNNVILKKYIKDLPPGLRSMATQFAYNAGQWHTRLLIVANSLDSNLGITVKQSMNIDPVDTKLSDEANIILANGSAYMRDSNGLATSEIVNRSETILQQDRANLFTKQYDQIISLYKSNPDIFLSALKSETDRFYKALVQGNKDSNLYKKNNPNSVGNRKVENRWLPKSEGGQSEDLQSFYTEYVNKAYTLANKYKNCSSAFTTPATTTPTTTVQQPTSEGEQTDSVTIPVKGIVIGDSQTPSIKSNSKKLQPLTAEGILWKGGWHLRELLPAVQKYPKDDTITHVFINIGTNGTFNKSDDIKGLVTSLRLKFPNAKLYVIKGSWGWSQYNQNVTDQQINDYYNIFSSNGVTILKNGMGYSDKHPSAATPSLKTIGQEIDDILIKAKPINVQTKEETQQPTVTIEETPESPAAKVDEMEESTSDGLEFLPEEEQFAQSSLVPTNDGLVRHDDVAENSEYFIELNENINVSTEKIFTKGIDNDKLQQLKQKLTTPILAYLNHNQGSAGLQTILYYTFKEPSNKIPKYTLIDKNKKISYGKDLNKNLYGKLIGYENPPNVGEVDFKKRFGTNKDTSFTPANFLSWWIINWEDKKSKYNKYGKEFDPLLTKVAKYYNVPFEQVKLTAFVESGIKPNEGNKYYKGLFAISPDYFNKFWSVKKNDQTFLKQAGLTSTSKFDNIYDAELNAWAGVSLLVEELQNASKFTKLYIN